MMKATTPGVGVSHFLLAEADIVYNLRLGTCSGQFCSFESDLALNA